MAEAHTEGTRPATARLRRDDWAEAALEVIARDGVPALAVEPLARRLGVTKGSFYWHFRTRRELLEAALIRWERERTDLLLERGDAIADPRARLEEWARHALFADKSLLAALHAAAEDPVVGPVLARVTERRIDWLARLLRDAGVKPAAAERRARLLYAADLGLFEIGKALPGARPKRRELGAFVDELAGFLDGPG